MNKMIEIMILENTRRIDFDVLEFNVIIVSFEFSYWVTYSNG